MRGLGEELSVVAVGVSLECYVFLFYFYQLRSIVVKLSFTLTGVFAVRYDVILGHF